MSDLAIRVSGLGKRYRIGQANSSRSLRGAVARAFTAPFRHFSRPNGQTAKPDDLIWALKDVSFEVKPGEVVGIIGRNGAGKSTLLKILSRITEPTEGRAEIHGRIGSLLEVGTGFHPDLTGRENVYLNGMILGMKKAEIDRKFDEIVAFSGIEKFIDTPVKRYSSGMHVRLGFSVAAHLQPEILLIDEVLAVGDAGFQEKCLRRMEGVSKEGRTILFVSHNLQAVTTLCPRTLLLEEGEVAAQGPSHEVVADYLAKIRERRMPVQGDVDLCKSHPGRIKRTEGIVEFTHGRLVGRDGQRKTTFRCGDELHIILGYRTNAPLGGSHVSFAYTVLNASQHRLFCCTSDSVGYRFDSLGTEGEVECVIPRLPLLPGKYTVNVGCMVGPTHSDGIYDAIEFEVVSSDYFGTGVLPPEEWGSLLVGHQWNLLGAKEFSV